MYYNVNDVFKRDHLCIYNVFKLLVMCFPPAKFLAGILVKVKQIIAPSFVVHSFVVVIFPMRKKLKWNR